jgi:hypothetical protein
MRFLVLVLTALIVLIPCSSQAQGAPSGTDAPRFSVDVNVFGRTESLASNRVFSSRSLVFSEIATTTASYPEPRRLSRAVLDFGGSMRLGQWFSTGIQFSRVVFEDGVKLSATIPHPVFLLAPATGSAESSDLLKRRETALHVYLALLSSAGRRYEWRMYGGLSLFAYSADMVRTVNYSQTFDPVRPQSTITVTGQVSETKNAYDLGMNGGADFTYFLNRTLGLSLGWRYSQGTVTIDESLSGLTQRVRVGGTQMITGVRFRLGN